MNPRPTAQIKASADDFVVEELPAYAPSGQGSHLFVRFTKRNLTTEQAMAALASALDTSVRDAGCAGMKDKVAVTTQTISLAIPPGVSAATMVDRAHGVVLDGITVHEAVPHGNKLKPGHLAGNRFSIVVRGIERSRLPEVAASFERMGREGVRNDFGSQRFGRDGQNAERALAWLGGKAPAPRSPYLRRLLFSSLQSVVFNDVLEQRVADGTWATALEGDLLKVHASGGLFLCVDAPLDAERALRGEVSPTGPMVGVKMREPSGAPQALERSAIDKRFAADFDWAKTKALGEGTRRPLRIHVNELTFAPMEGDLREERTGCRVTFVLPKGAYATTVLSQAVSLDQNAGESDGADRPREESPRT